MKPKRILVPIDFSESCRKALAEADEFGVGGAQLTLLHVYEITQVAIMDFAYVEPPEHVAQISDAAEGQLRDWAKDLATPPERLTVNVVTGSPVHEINERSKDFDLIVMPTHARGKISRFLLGSVAERVVQGAECSVLVVKGSAK